MFEKAVIVTRKTRLEELIARFNTKSQAKFYIEHSGGDFKDYQTEHDNYMRSLEVVRSQLNHGLKTLFLDRSFLPSIMITAEDVVVTVGQDGLVANTAKYIGRQPLIAVNPDPQRFDGILLPFKPEDLSRALSGVMDNSFSAKYVTNR